MLIYLRYIVNEHGNQNKEKKRWLLWPSAQKYSQSTLAQLKKIEAYCKNFCPVRSAHALLAKNGHCAQLQKHTCHREE